MLLGSFSFGGAAISPVYAEKKVMLISDLVHFHLLANRLRHFQQQIVMILPPQLLLLLVLEGRPGPFGRVPGGPQRDGLVGDVTEEMRVFREHEPAVLHRILQQSGPVRTKDVCGVGQSASVEGVFDSQEACRCWEAHREHHVGREGRVQLDRDELRAVSCLQDSLQDVAINAVDVNF